MEAYNNNDEDLFVDLDEPIIEDKKKKEKEKPKTHRLIRRSNIRNGYFIVQDIYGTYYRLSANLINEDFKSEFFEVEDSVYKQLEEKY